MVTIVSPAAAARRPAPASSFIRRLDELGPVVLLAAVLAVLAAAAYEARSTHAEGISVARMMAE